MNLNIYSALKISKVVIVLGSVLTDLRSQCPHLNQNLPEIPAQPLVPGFDLGKYGS